MEAENPLDSQHDIAQEAIMSRVYCRMGLNEEEIARFFTNPAHLP